MSATALYLLGSPYVTVDGRLAHIHRRQSLGLLAYLALEKGPHTRDALTALFWPELDQAHSRAELRRALSALTKDLGNRVVDADREMIILDAAADLYVDASDFLARISSTDEHDR